MLLLEHKRPRRDVLIDALKNMAKMRALTARKVELLNEMERAIAHEVSKLDNISFGHREYKVLKRAYEEALKAGKLGSDVIEVELQGKKREFVVAYAYYVLQYLLPQFGGMMDVIRRPKDQA